MKPVAKILSLLIPFAFCAFASAGQLIVLTPNDGDFLGSNSQLSFQLKNAVVKTHVTATVTQVSNPSNTIVVQGDFNPDTNGNATGSLNLNFSSVTPEGDYKITVTATEPNNTYTPVTRSIKVDVNPPKFLTSTPLTNSFVKGIVPIKVKLLEPNVKEWRVQINNQDIPNNSGSSDMFTVMWDTSAITKDGPQTITIAVTDLAGNTANRSISVTVDRIAPTITVLKPSSSDVLLPGANISVSFDVHDQSGTSVDQTGIDVVLKTLDGQFIQHVARQSVVASSDGQTWTGRVLWSNRLPKQFKLVISAVDKAGNNATSQEVILSIGRSRKQGKH